MRIDMELGSRSYPILVERGCLNRLGSLANLQRNILVVTDTGVPKPLVEAAGPVPPGPSDHPAPGGGKQKPGRL